MPSLPTMTINSCKSCIYSFLGFSCNHVPGTESKTIRLEHEMYQFWAAMNPWKLLKIWLKNANSLCYDGLCQSQTVEMSH